MDNKVNNEKKSKNKLFSILKEVSIYILIIIVVVLIRIFIVTPVRVDGDSMNDNLKNGEILLLKKYDKSFERFDVIVFKYKNEKLVKRIIGLPGEKIVYKDNKLYINDKYIEENMIDKKTYDFDLRQLGFDTIPKDYYFVMGDNRTNSTDSRIIGLVSKEDILGSTNFILFPFNKLGSINK